jgi:hypothetical protein
MRDIKNISMGIVADEVRKQSNKKIKDAIYCEPFHYYDSAEDFEVIGNIYENPELLKKDET